MKMQNWANGVVCLVVFGVICLGFMLVAESSDVAALLNPEPEVSETVHALGKKVELDSYEFELNQVTKEIAASFEVVNHSRQPVRDVVVSCEYRDREEELRGRGRWVLYGTVEPGATGAYTLSERRYISHLVVPETIDCAVTDLDARLVATVANHGSAH